MPSQKSSLAGVLLNVLLLPLLFCSQISSVSGTTVNMNGDPITNAVDAGADVARDVHADGVEERAAAALTLDQAVALKVQNNGRKAVNVTLLVWDATLAAHAQTWANYLAKIDKLQHSTSAQRPGEGENLAWAWATNGIKYPLTQGAQGWMAEEKNYHGELIPQGDFASYGHYTQCVWKSTTKIGMANATAANGGVYTVGRYAPAGNYVGQKPY